MNLTTKEKIDLLKYVRNSLLEDLDSCFFGRGICYYVVKYTGYPIKDSIPELLKYKPADAGDYWFSKDKAGHGKRINIVNQTLFDLENSLQGKEIEEVYFKCKPENILLTKSKENDNIYYNSNDGEISLYVHKFFIKQNPDLFIVKTKQDLLNDSMNDKLYSLQEHCKSRIPAEKNEDAYYTLKYDNDRINIVSYMRFSLYLTGSNIRVRFDSEEQAIMFLYKINLPENKELRNYFINILKD